VPQLTAAQVGGGLQAPVVPQAMVALPAIPYPSWQVYEAVLPRVVVVYAGAAAFVTAGGAPQSRGSQVGATPVQARSLTETAQVRS
jgi:hypothetical protein